MRHHTAHWAPLALLVCAACAGNTLMPNDDAAPAAITVAPAPAVVNGPVALIDDDGQLGVVRDGAVTNEWFKFDAFASPDGSHAVMTLGPDIHGIGHERPMYWVELPSAEMVGAEVMMPSDAELTATSLDGSFAAFTTYSGRTLSDAIAPSRRSSTIRIAHRDRGFQFEQILDGNFEPEAFSSQLTADGLPTQLFLLEYFPADQPTFYRVRVLSTETGGVSLPLNLRDKSQLVDERMAGFTRSQVVAHDAGLLFTLYRGTIDGRPDGEPYAFVHTLDFNDGVWCLEVDPRLELDQVSGSLAVAGDRLYVVSANGHVGSYAISSIVDANLSPSMDWVTDLGIASSETPLIVGGADSAFITDATRPGFVHRVGADGAVLEQVLVADARPEALAWTANGLAAIAGESSTAGDFRRPDWLERVVHLVVG